MKFSLKYSTSRVKKIYNTFHFIPQQCNMKAIDIAQGENVSRIQTKRVEMHKQGNKKIRNEIVSKLISCKTVLVAL